MSMSRVRGKSGKASLVGGIVVGVASFILWVVIERDAGAVTPLWTVAGAVVAAVIGTWIKVADL